MLPSQSCALALSRQPINTTFTGMPPGCVRKTGKYAQETNTVKIFFFLIQTLKKQNSSQSISINVLIYTSQLNETVGEKPYRELVYGEGDRHTPVIYGFSVRALQRDYSLPLLHPPTVFA